MHRRFVLASLLLAGVTTVKAQSAIQEYRPEIVLTLPRYQGFGLQLLLEQHLETSTLAANERIQGVGLVSPTIYEPIALRLVVEARQVITPAVTEHRYIPTALTTLKLGNGWEMRSRTRAEVRDINQDWSVRWQDRSAIGHEVELFDHPLFPYGQFDLSFDSRVNTLNRIEKTVGGRYGFTHDASVDLFFTRQDDTRRTPRTLYAYGAILRVQM